MRDKFRRLCERKRVNNNMKNDLVFLCQFFYPETVSSATLPFDTATHFALQGYSVGALCGYPKEYTDEKHLPYKEEVQGINIKRIKYIYLKRSNPFGRVINYFSFIIKAMMHVFTLRKYKCIFVYTNPPVLPLVALAANRLFRTKIVFIAYDIYPEIAYATGSIGERSLISILMNYINKRLYERAACIVAITDEMKDLLLKNRKQLNTDRIKVIPNWAHEKDVRDSTAQDYHHFGFRENQFIVSYFGNMGTCQDVDTMMGAAELLKDNEEIRFLIAGHGNKKQRVIEWIAEKGLNNVKLVDYLIGDEFNTALSISSCSIVSLERGLKGTCAPSKYLSYLQAGCPVIAIADKDSYLCKEIKCEDIGLTVEQGDSKRLAEKLIYLEINSDSCNQMSKRAQKLYQREYSFNKAMKAYQEMIQEVLDSKYLD